MSEDKRICEECIYWCRAYDPESIFRASEPFGWCNYLKDFTHEDLPPAGRACNYEMVSDEEFEGRQALIKADMDLREKLREKKQ